MPKFLYWANMVFVGLEILGCAFALFPPANFFTAFFLMGAAFSNYCAAQSMKKWLPS